MDVDTYEVRLLQLGKADLYGQVYADTPQTRKAIETFAARGEVYCELGNPNRPPLSTVNDWVHRFASVDERRVCAKLKDLRLEGNLLLGNLTGAGPLNILKFLDGPDDLKVGIRCFSKRIEFGRREIDTIVTYDVVGLNERGVSMST